uniref:NADH dehydrogenase [ubiquinone] 1 alpha subcomplex subunit 12 n=1 Tax=Acanthochromis polyacanthus TaxID=80966 RepID=A0A3Q1GNY4_9TELE
MAEYANIVRRALGQIGGHGGVRGFFLQLFRVNDIKTGTLIGVDKYGNKYYEDNKHYFFGEGVQHEARGPKAVLQRVQSKCKNYREDINCRL